MALNIEAHWHHPVLIEQDFGDGDSLFKCRKLEDVPEEPGIYVFIRTHGSAVEPLYVGQSKNLRRRLVDHFKKNVRLMKGILLAPSGAKKFLFCTIRLKRGQNLDRVLDVLENMLISHALNNGYELYQKQGTKPSSHQAHFTGNRISERVSGRTMYTRAN
jgi:hypothetical protein